MKRSTLISLFLIATPVYLFAQTGELASSIEQLQRAVVTVQTGSKTYEPRISTLQPGVVLYAYDETDQKGNHTTYSYEFNLSDIDPYAVREQTQKDVINVILAVRNKQKLVKVYKNNEVQPYDDQVAIIAKDIENARAISDIVKKAIPPAEKITANRLKLSGYDAMISWLTSNVKNASAGSKSVTQTLTKTDNPGGLLLTQVESDGKTSNEEQYTFNLADINVNTISFKVSGNKLGINFETLQKDKYIAARKNKEVKPYVNEVTINTNSVDEARDIKTVLTMAVPLAAEKVKGDMPVLNTEKAALDKVQAFASEVDLGGKQVTQSFEPACFTTFVQVEKDPKKTEKNSFQFNFMDINPNATSIDVMGEKMFVHLAINDKKKLILHKTDDKLTGYDDDIKVYTTDIESARRMKFAIDQASEKCKASYKEPFGNDIHSTSAWLSSNIKEVSWEDVTLKQTLEPVEEGNDNKLKFTSRELNSKGTGAEEVYELNLSDINPLSIETDVKGKVLYVSMETDFKGKIIKYYKDGKIQPYANKVEFAVTDTEAARNIMGALKKLVSALKKK